MNRDNSNRENIKIIPNNCSSTAIVGDSYPGFLLIAFILKDHLFSSLAYTSFQSFVLQAD